jgi:hypothetical protein
MAKAQSRKPIKAAKATKGVAKKAATPKKATYQPLKGISHALVDFKDKILEEKIKELGGTTTRSIKTADRLVCEDFMSDKAEDAYCKYNKQDCVVMKDELEEQIAHFSGVTEKTYPQLTIGKTAIDMRVEWFTQLGEPVGLNGQLSMFGTDACVSVVSNGGAEHYDCCYHEDGNIREMFSRLCRLQLVYNATNQEYTVTTFLSWLNDIANGSETCMRSTSRWQTEEEAIAAFESDFRDAMGFTWKNRMTCKPKKGSGLLADLSSFRK